MKKTTHFQELDVWKEAHEFVLSVYGAQGSLEECRYYLILTADLGYGTNHRLKEQLESTSRLLSAYIRGTQKNYYRLPTTNYQLPTTDYRLPSTVYCLPSTDYCLPSTYTNNQSSILIPAFVVKREEK